MSLAFPQLQSCSEIPTVPKRVLLYAYSLSCVQLFLTPWTIACQAPLSMEILQARILERVTIPSSRGSFQSRD